MSSPQSSSAKTQISTEREFGRDKLSKSTPLEVVQTEVHSVGNRNAHLGLDFFNLCAADIRDGLGPFLTVFLLSRNWSPAAIGWALSVSSFTSLIATTPAGLLLDRMDRKKFAVAIASLLIALATFGIWSSQNFWLVLAFQALTGIASAFIGPAIALLSRAVSGPELLSVRMGRNEIFNHTGNFGAAALSAFLVSSYGIGWIFGLVIFMSIVSIFALIKISSPRPGTISTQRPDRSSNEFHFSDLFEILKDPQSFLLLSTAFLFQFANASLLPIMAQVRSAGPSADGVQFLSIGIVIAQLVSIPAAWCAGQATRRWGAKTCIAVGLSAVAIRSLIFLTTGNLALLEVGQIFDGISAGVIAVAPIVALFERASSAAEGRGNYGFLAGALAMLVGLGATLSSLVGGYVYQYLGSSIYLCSTMMVVFIALALLLKPNTGRLLGLNSAR